MVQKEKQEHMLRTAKKKYGKNIRITFAEKDVLRFVTDTLAVTMKCHNNGVIDERTRKRPKMKSSELCHESGKRPKAKLLALSPKDERPRARASESGQKQDKSSTKKESVQKTVSKTIPKRKVSPVSARRAEDLRPDSALAEVSVKTDQPKTDLKDLTPLSTPSEPKCPFHVGDHVKSLYSDTRYTVSAIESYSLVHVTEEGDLFGRTMSSADLISGTKPRKGKSSADLVGSTKKAKRE